MANFIVTQQLSVQGLCETLKSTDNSDYTGNTEGITTSDVASRRWIFKNGSGTVIKDVTYYGNNVTSESCPISLLSLNVSVEMIVVISHSRYGGTYTVYNSFLIPCLLV